MKLPRLVAVTWEDAHTPDSGGWIDPGAVTNWQTGTLATSVGFLLAKTERVVKVVGSITVNQEETEIEQVSGTIVIPRGMVRKIRYLR